MKNYRRKYIRAITCSAAAAICAFGIWHQSQMRTAAAQLEVDKTQTRMFYQFGEATRAAYALRLEGASLERIASQTCAAGNYLAGLSISPDAKEILFTWLNSFASAEYCEAQAMELNRCLQSSVFVESTNVEKAAMLEKLCKQIKLDKHTDAEGLQAGAEYASKEVREALSWIFENNENFSVSGNRNDTVYFYYGNRYLAVYGPLHLPYFYAFGCVAGEAVLDRSTCCKNAVVFLQRTLPPALRGNGVPKEMEEKTAQDQEGCYYFSFSYPAYPTAPITVGVRRDTGSVIFMNAEALLTGKIADNSRKSH